MTFSSNPRRLRACLVPLAAMALVIANALPASAESAEFAKIRADVTQQWPNVKHVPADVFAKLAENGGILLDARSAAEYEVSHIAGAIRVEPGMTASDFRSQFASRIKDKMVLVYCSVGVRSSKLATTIAGEVDAAGGKGVVNLSGGIFGWHNEARPLVDAKGPTSYVHAYSASWGTILSRPELIRNETASAR